MPTLRDRYGMALAFVVVLSIAGCGGNGDGGVTQDGGNGQDSERSGRAPGAPFGQPDQVAVGSPIRVPAITAAQGQPLDEVLGRIKAHITDQCGGELCVTLRVEERDVSDFTSCQFVTTDPAPRTWVDQGTTVVIVAGAQPCDGPDDDSEPSGEVDGDEEPDGDEEQSDGDDGEPANGDGEPADDPSQPAGTP
ncbi:MAG: hypothetical protein GEU83_08500 [Pseudonocardiaceae bacterium]|nr:hypothetical protein [Pseudonocardiaceae bacterium]